MAKKVKEKEMTIREKLVSADGFKKHCENAGMEATPRQFSKFQRGKGKVYRTQILKETVL